MPARCKRFIACLAAFQAAFESQKVAIQLEGTGNGPLCRLLDSTQLDSHERKLTDRQFKGPPE